MARTTRNNLVRQMTEATDRFHSVARVTRSILDKLAAYPHVSVNMATEWAACGQLGKRGAVLDVAKIPPSQTQFAAQPRLATQILTRSLAMKGHG